MKNKLPVIVAAIVAILALVAIKMYVNNIRKQQERENKGPVVICARADIKPGTVLDLKMLTTNNVPERFLPSQAIEFKASNVRIIVGQKTSMLIKKGKPLSWSDLAVEKRGGFETVVPQGERAFTIKASDGVRPGLLQPGDHVDILATFALPDIKSAIPEIAPAEPSWRQRSDMVNIVLLQNVTVLAVGESYTPEGPARASSDVTLAVTLPEAQLLMFAAQHGDLGVVLRRNDDIETSSREELPKVTFEAIEKLIGDLDSKRKLRIVQVQKGAKTENVSVTDEAADQGQDQ